MPTYEIQQWNSVIPKSPPGSEENNFPMPMIYIKADKWFENYATKNNYMVLINIEGSDSQYDNHPTIAVIDNSGYYPNYRPRFFNDTHYYVLTLACGWLGYPRKNGRVIMKGQVGPDKIEAEPPVPFVAPKPLQWPTEMYTATKTTDGSDGKLSSKQIWIIAGLLIAVFSFFVFLSVKNSLKN